MEFAKQFVYLQNENIAKKNRVFIYNEIDKNIKSETILTVGCRCDPMKSSKISFNSKNLRKIDLIAFTGLRLLQLL